MASPFPGMNPFLEQTDAWGDFHLHFIARAQEMLAAEVGPNYVVKVEERLLLHELSAKERGFIGKADVSVATAAKAAGPTPATASGTAPIQLRLPAVEVEKHRAIEIRDRRNRRVVTVIELLSPSNKTPGSDRDDYLAKRRQVLASHTHLVEIDFRRGGTRPNLPELPPCDYYVLVSRYEDRPQVGFWPIGLRERLPIVPIPLVMPDPDVSLDLKAVLDRAYDAADFGKYIYQESPEPPLSPEELSWARPYLQ